MEAVADDHGAAGPVDAAVSGGRHDPAGTTRRSVVEQREAGAVLQPRRIVAERDERQRDSRPGAGRSTRCHRTERVVARRGGPSATRDRRHPSRSCACRPMPGTPRLSAGLAAVKHVCPAACAGDAVPATATTSATTKVVLTKRLISDEPTVRVSARTQRSARCSFSETQSGGPAASNCSNPASSRIVHAELLGLGELRARALADHDVARLLRHAAGDLAAARLDLGRGFVARAPFERAGEHEREPGERRRRPARPPAPARLRSSRPRRASRSTSTRGCDRSRTSVRCSARSSGRRRRSR